MRQTPEKEEARPSIYDEYIETHHLGPIGWKGDLYYSLYVLSVVGALIVAALLINYLIH